MSPAVSVAERSLGGYDVLYELKAGGMGEVLLARKLGAGGFEKLVAIKTIRSDLRDLDELRAMFLDEARLLGRLNHPAIAQVHDFGEDGDTLYLAMEYVAGVRFSELTRMDPPPVVAARAMAQVCRGLHAAHELKDLAGTALNVVHRDVSPENLMLTFDGRVKVLDFGIALVRGRQAPVTEFGTIKGKPPYLSPEQIKNEPVDRRTDIFAAAVVLHEMLTGEQVFDGDSVYAVARAIEHEDVAPPSELAGELPQGLDEAVMRGLQRDPAERYQTALQMAEALEAACNWAGGASLEAYAKGELKQTGDEHRTWLHDLVTSAGANTGGSARGRPSGVMTARGQEVLEEQLELSEGTLAKMPKGPSSTGFDSLGADTGHSTMVRRKRSRVVALLALLLGVGIMVAAGWLVTRGGGADKQTRRHAAVIDAATMVDATSARSADATAVAVVMDAGAGDARPVVRVPSRVKVRPTRRRIDAGARRLVIRRRPDAAPTPTKVIKYGFVTIAADPFALIRIDGKQIGPTPKFRYQLAVGRHEIKLVSPDTGKVRLVRTVTIREGKLSQVISR